MPTDSARFDAPAEAVLAPFRCSTQATSRGAKPRRLR
jgi:hypothetical protein